MPTPVPPQNCCFSFGGFFLVRFSFSVRSRSSARRVSVPFRRVAGLALSGSSLCLLCASFLLGGRPPFFGDRSKSYV